MTPGKTLVSGNIEYDPDDQVGAMLRKAYQRHLSIFAQLISERNVTSTQFSSLCVLDRSGPMSQAELCAQSSIDQGTIRGIIERLRGRGLIKLDRDQVDGRRIVISISAQGRDLVREVIPLAAQVTEQTYDDLNVAERVALAYLLKKIAKGRVDGEAE